MDANDYITHIAEPTVDDFGRNPMSVRHLFLACVATYHTIDRVEPKSARQRVLRKWRKESIAFVIVDMVAHHFKHVKSHDERPPLREGIPLWDLEFGADFDMRAIRDGQIDRNLYFVVRDAIKFVRGEIVSAGPLNVAQS